MKVPPGIKPFFLEIIVRHDLSKNIQGLLNSFPVKLPFIILKDCLFPANQKNMI